MPALDWGITYYAYQNSLDRRRQEQLLLARSEQLLRRDVRIAYALHAGAVRQERMLRLALMAGQEVLRIARSLEKEKMAVRADTALVEAAVAQASLEHALAARRVHRRGWGFRSSCRCRRGRRSISMPICPICRLRLVPALVAAYEDRALVRTAGVVGAGPAAAHFGQRHPQGGGRVFPRVDGIGSFNWTSNTMLVNPSYFLFGFSVAHSLLDGGGTIWRYELAKKTATLEEQRTLLLSLGVLYEVELRRLHVQQAWETIQAAAILEKARREALRRIVSMYREGLEDEAGAARSLADLTTQSTILDRAQTDYLIAWHELEAAALPEKRTAAATRPTSRPAWSAPLGLPSLEDFIKP